MSTLTHTSMTNHHAPSLIQQVLETVHVWYERYRNRRELTHWTARDLQDVGLSWRSRAVHWVSSRLLR